jgi:TolA-binding protein
MENKEEKNTGLDLDTTLIETKSKVETLYSNYKKQINMGILIALLAVAGYYGFTKFYLEPQEKEAQAALFPAQSLFEKDSIDAALAIFETVSNDYGLTKAGNLAHYYAGVCYMRKGEFQNAIDQLDKFNTDNELVAPLAIGLKGDAHVELNDISKGASLYMKAANASKNKLTAPIFLKKAGLAFEELKEFDEAAAAYEKIKKEYADAQEAQDIDKFIARAQAGSAE